MRASKLDQPRPGRQLDQHNAPLPARHRATAGVKAPMKAGATSHESRVMPPMPRVAKSTACRQSPPPKKSQFASLNKEFPRNCVACFLAHAIGRARTADACGPDGPHRAPSPVAGCPGRRSDASSARGEEPSPSSNVLPVANPSRNLNVSARGSRRGVCSFVAPSGVSWGFESAANASRPRESSI